jgi:hypothetical protein
MLFMDEARFGRDGISSVNNQHQWAEKNFHCVIYSRYQLQFSINMWAGTVGDCLIGQFFCHIGLQATTTEILSYMICQSCWKMYHWESEQKCGTCAMVLRHILAVLCEMFSVTRIMTDGYVEEDPLHGLHARRTSILWIFTCGDT